MKKFISSFMCLIILSCAVLFGCGAEKIEPVAEFKLNNLPDYYSYYMYAKIGQINLNEERNTVDASFIFLTDAHWDCNAKNSPMLLKSVCENTNVSKAVFGGDYISMDYEDVESPLSVMSDFAENFDFCENYVILGNHDTNRNVYGDTQAISFADSMLVLSGGKNDNSYYEATENKIHYLFLNTNDFKYGGEQFNWLKQKLLSYSADEYVIVFMHEYFTFFDGKHATKREQANVLESLLVNNSENFKCTIIGVFSGHVHNDYMARDACGNQIIATTCDGIDVTIASEPYYRERGTITEQAFDVVQVDLTGRKVFLTRIGAGSDREYVF